MDYDALGLVCDPEEISEGTSVQVLVSASSPVEKSIGIFTSLGTSSAERLDASQDMFSQNEVLVDDTVPSNSSIQISQIEDEIEDIEETPINQPWDRSPIKVADAETHSQIIQQTMVFEAIEPSQRWSFSQLERTQKNVLTLNIKASPEQIAEADPSQPIQQTMIFEPLEPSQRWSFSQLEHTQDTDHIPTQSPNTIEQVSISSTQQETQRPPSQDRHTAIPTSICELYSSVTERYSEFCYSYTLASQLCPQIYPMNTYTDLKLCLLLSIASIHKNSISPPFHVISIGPDTAVAHLLMRSIGQLARRFIAAMLDPVAGGRVLHDNFVECGSTTLARSGVCYLGDWGAQKPSNQTRILREIESGRVIIENHAIAYPLECAIWSNWNYTRKAKRDMSTIVAFLNTFGIPIILPDETPDAMISFMLEHSLANHDPTLQEPLVSDEDVREFMAMIYYQTVTVSEEANNFLSRYFVLTRLNVPESLTQASLLALQKLSEAHARLCFRSEASRLDAVVAIMICERFVHAVFTNPGNAAPLLENLASIDDVECYFERFDQWLQEFLNRSCDSQ